MNEFNRDKNVRNNRTKAIKKSACTTEATVIKSTLIIHWIKIFHITEIKH